MKKCFVATVVMYVLCATMDWMFEESQLVIPVLKKLKPDFKNTVLPTEILRQVANENKTAKNTTNCFKTTPSQTYKICETLPYTTVQCGPDYSESKQGFEKPYLVPDVVFFIWFGNNLTFRYYNYLALRSVAGIHRPRRIDFYYSETLPVGKYWDQTVREVPCLNLLKVEEPRTIGDNTINDPIQRTDIARLNILIESGGIYIDGDVITIKKFDKLREFPATVGRSTVRNVCICVVMSRKNSLFIREFYKEIPEHNVGPPWRVFTTFLAEFISETKFKVHVEETSINRPNPHVTEDGDFGSTLSQIDLSGNYFLHLHPKKISRSPLDPNWDNWEVETLRKLDGAYGEAARIALFGSSDLIFMPGEDVYEMQPKVQMVKFQPLVQRNAVIDDVD